jgi:methylated-DNA-[protein]-cysteine S-methyltransferase
MRYAVIETPLGELTLASTPRGLTSIYFGRTLPEGGVVDVESNRVYINQIEEYFLGRRTAFDFPLDLRGTDFQVAVWRELLEIPYGQTRTYGEIAKKLGKPRAARAVGMANHDNRIPIVVPCHRVVGHDGSLTGYAGGLQIKQQLLDHERSECKPDRAQPVIDERSECKPDATRKRDSAEPEGTAQPATFETRKLFL